MLNLLAVTQAVNEEARIQTPADWPQSPCKFQVDASQECQNEDRSFVLNSVRDIGQINWIYLIIQNVSDTISVSNTDRHCARCKEMKQLKSFSVGNSSSIRDVHSV